MIDLQKRQREYYAARRRLWKPAGNRASQIGHPCEMYLYLARTAWDQRTLPDVELQAIFERGSALEAINRRRLEEMGYTVEQAQRPLEWPEFEITGHIDGILRDGKGAYPFDLKTATRLPPGVKRYIENPTRATARDAIAELLRSPKLWERKYPGQILSYLWLLNDRYAEESYDIGMLIFDIKAEGWLYEVPIWRDDWLDEMEVILRRLERVNRAVRDKNPAGLRRLCADRDDGEFSPADRWQYYQSCDLSHVCMPDVSVGGVRLINDQEAVEMVERYLEIAEQAKPLDAEKKRIREVLKDSLVSSDGSDVVVVGDYAVRLSRFSIKHIKEAKL